MGREVLPPGRTEPASDALVGGRYRLERSLGNGGMGEVFVATDTTLGRRVALKRLAPALTDDDDARSRFFREARALARINSSNVVAVFDAAGDGDPFLVMELIEGTTLREELRRKARLPPERAVAIGSSVAAGLAAAHAQGVIHRDVKPSNIFLTSAGEPKVGDFGIARLERGDQTLTMTGQAFGSPAYIAPEQATGGRVDARADLYSLGCVMYEMLAGRRPFEGNDAVSLTYQHVHTAPVRLDAIDGRISPQLAVLVGSLLAKDPADRPATADAVRRELASTPATRQDELPPVDEREGTAVLPGRAAALGTKRTRPWLAMVALAGAIVISVLALANAFTNDGRRSHPRRSAQASPAAPTSPATTSRAPTSSAPGVSNPAQAGAALVTLAQQIAVIEPPVKHVADDIEHTVQDVLEHLDEPSESIDKLNELKGQIAEEAARGHLTSTDAARLDAAIDAFARAVSSGGEGD